MNNIKKNNEKNNEKLFFLTFENVSMKIIPPTRHIKYKRIDVAPCNEQIKANKLLSTNLERFLRRIRSLLKR